MKKDENKKGPVLDLDKYKGKSIDEMTEKEWAEVLSPFSKHIIEATKASVKLGEYYCKTSGQMAVFQKAFAPQLSQIIVAQKSCVKAMQGFDQINKNILKNFETLIDTRWIAQSILDGFRPTLEILQKSIINLNTLNSVGRLNDNTLIALQLKSVRQTSETEAKAHSTAKTETSFKAVSLTQTAEIGVIFSTIDSKLDSKLDKADFTKEISDIKDLIREFKNDVYKVIPALVKEVKFDPHKLTLKINGKEIRFQPEKKQTLLCQLFFGNKEGITKRLHIEEIIEAFGEKFSSVDIGEWDKQFYQATRHLNEKIAVATGLNGFIKVSNQYYEVNPEYRSLF